MIRFMRRTFRGEKDGEEGLLRIFGVGFGKLLGALDLVEEVIKFVRQSCGGMLLYLWASILQGLVWQQDYELTKRFYDQTRKEDAIKPDLNVSCLMISTSLDSNGVLATLKRFEELSVQPDVVSFTILLNVLIKLCCGRNGAKKLSEMMEKLGVKAKFITHGSIVHHLCMSGEVEELEIAAGLVDEIDQKGIATTAITYTALIQGYLRAYVNEHRTSSTQPTPKKHPINEVVQHALQDAFLSTNQIAEAMEFLKDSSYKKEQGSCIQCSEAIKQRQRSSSLKL
ncbi:uncharacterized protein MELLADRAFT_105513 [Melampsora larici-populina 98AG31]|uniref:Pentacotripeptide-repeat region of PRORP domain-containing protein n=1 Tax=Melampsora larici-populina (strain 98AG31 / pathotype 3-4-7) TaxID=747676 RepID=F4RIG5_MELLP|nr:uncharacterized protein MELLADRAFT_105513 [Melampsora larici-populina 98AG31]EGG07837.1 hypothetical protein MELLADRAFT_105513 [Melampsora larici-populina 98AG31]